MSTSFLFPFALLDEVREHLGDGSDLFELVGEQSKLFFDAGRSEADNNPRLEAFSAAFQQRDAIARGDHNLLNTLKSQTNQDLKANIDAISKSRGKAFLEAINKSDKKHYHICPSNGGYMWVIPLSVQTEKLSDNKINTRATVSVGSFSKNTNFMGISTRSWTSIPGTIANGGISFMVSRIVAEFFASRVADMIYKVSFQVAVAAVAAKIAGLVAASLIMIVAYLVVMFIIDFIHRSYGLTVNIYNYSEPTSWVFNDWYNDNSKIDDMGGTENFVVTLDKVSSMIVNGCKLSVFACEYRIRETQALDFTWNMLSIAMSAMT
ncbi:pyk10-binding 1 [Fusarium heterosporum]|uniref:Pyk10-binding 1 n=1 Tax=Fusarium heterosporum TaxID=42747 RepID=A0A8H5WDB1_FUSHE|nr:pyk10-binding 1 [Fusarium heterosporum]